MKINRWLMTICLLVIFQVPVFVIAETLFMEDFDNQKDWYPKTSEEGCNNSSCIDTLPVGWNYYRNDELWHPKDNANFHPTIQISSENYRGNSGKSLTIWNESNIGRSGDGWGADGQLTKDLGSDYSELSVEFYIKYKEGFKLNWDNDNGADMKTFRIYHWDRVGSPFQFFSTGKSAPIYLFHVSKNRYGFRHFHSYRCDPQETKYNCTIPYNKSYNFTDKPDFTDSLGDGKWHKLKWRIKINSAPGMEDGELEFWCDNKLELSRNDIRWIEEGGTKGIAWNTIGFGGNAYNLYSDPINKSEQSYSIDDIKICLIKKLDKVHVYPIK